MYYILLEYYQYLSYGIFLASFFKQSWLNFILGSIICAVSCSPSDIYCLLMPKLEAGQVKLQSRLEEEEEAKAALMGRIQRLTKLILVSTKNALPSSIPERPGNRRRHSFGEDEVCNFANLFCVTNSFLMVQKYRSLADVKL